MKKLFNLWLPPIAWMGVIFFLSSLQSTGVGLPFSKIAHLIEYAVLYALLFRAKKNHLFSGAVSILYAISDEYHQTFVPTRHGLLTDVLIDSLGVLLMYIYLKWKK